MWSWMVMGVMTQLVKHEEMVVKVEVVCSVMVVMMEGETVVVVTMGGGILVVVGLHQHHLYPVPSLKTHRQSLP